MSSLPLSWSLSDSSKINTIELPKSTFLYNSEVRSKSDFIKQIHRVTGRVDKPVLLRGILPELKNELLAQFGGQSLALGIAGAVSLKTFTATESVSALSRRASRSLEVKEVPGHMLQIEGQKLYRKSRLQNVPPLQYLFRTDTSECSVSFIAQSLSGADSPVALVSLTQRGPAHWHLEQMLRTLNAPVGAMELLFTHAMRALKQRGAAELHLGEVPFLQLPAATPGLSRLERLKLGSIKKVAVLSASSLYPVMNSDGLFQFKDKFHPHWEPVYWYSTGRFHFRDFFRLFQLTGCQSIAMQRMPSFTLKRAALRPTA
jgi:hypothetical protein